MAITGRSAPRGLRRGRVLRALGFWVGLVLTSILPGRASSAPANDSPIVGVIIATVTKISDIPSDVLRTAFRGLRPEYQGIHLTPFNLPLQTPARERLDRALLGLAPSEVGSYWVDQRVRDGRTPPRTVPSVDIATKVVAQLPGAIACVPLPIRDPRVRVLRVDGKGPSDKGYLLAPN